MRLAQKEEQPISEGEEQSEEDLVEDLVDMMSRPMLTDYE